MVTDYNLNKFIYFSEDRDFVSAISADPVEMLHDVAFHLGLHCVPNAPF